MIKTIKSREVRQPRRLLHKHSLPMGPTLKQNIPEVESYVRITNMGTQVKLGEKQLNELLTIGDRSIFDVFDFELLTGDRQHILQEANSIVLDQAVAIKYFAERDPINQTLSIQLGDSYHEFVVRGVSKIPTNSSVRFEMLIPDHNLSKVVSERRLNSAWFNIEPETYVLLQEGVRPENVTAKFPALFRSILGEEDSKKSNYAPDSMIAGQKPDFCPAVHCVACLK